MTQSDDRNDRKLSQPQPDDANTSIKPTSPIEIQVEDDRTGMTVQALKRAFADNLYYLLGKDESWATPHDYYMALAYTVRDRPCIMQFSQLNW